MKKFISIFVIIMIIGTMFAGCDMKEAAAEEPTVFVERILVEDILVEEVIVEEITTEIVVTWDDALTGWNDVT